MHATQDRAAGSARAQGGGLQKSEQGHHQVGCSCTAASAASSAPCLGLLRCWLTQPLQRRSTRMRLLTAVTAAATVTVPPALAHPRRRSALLMQRRRSGGYARWTRRRRGGEPAAAVAAAVRWPRHTQPSAAVVAADPAGGCRQASGGSDGQAGNFCLNKANFKCWF